jgi:hypothetical protein
MSTTTIRVAGAVGGAGCTTVCLLGAAATGGSYSVDDPDVAWREAAPMACDSVPSGPGPVWVDTGCSRAALGAADVIVVPGPTYLACRVLASTLGPERRAPVVALRPTDRVHLRRSDLESVLVGTGCRVCEVPDAASLPCSADAGLLLWTAKHYRYLVGELLEALGAEVVS